MAALQPTRPALRGRRHDLQPLDLVRHAVAAIASHAQRGVAWPGSPLVLVTADGPLGGRCLHDLHRSCAPRAGSMVWEGRELGMEIVAAGAGERLQHCRDRLLAGPVLAVNALHGLGSAIVQRRFAGMLDAATAAGATVCVTTSGHPAVNGFIPRLSSRLCAGLVVSLPAATEPTPALGVAQGSATRPALSAVIRTTARHLGLPAEQLVGAGRRRSVAQARSLAMYLSRQLTGRSLGEIGRALGGRDHSTVIHGIRNAAVRLGADAGFANDAATITADLLAQQPLSSRSGTRRSG